jgi:hypothetical protein
MAISTLSGGIQPPLSTVPKRPLAGTIPSKLKGDDDEGQHRQLFPQLCVDLPVEAIRQPGRAADHHVPTRWGPVIMHLKTSCGLVCPSR